MITSEVDSSIISVNNVFHKVRIFEEDGVTKYLADNTFEEELERIEDEKEIIDLIKKSFKENES